MPVAMRPYWRLLLAGVHRQSTYRLAMLGGLVANVTFGFLKATILLATAAAAGGHVAGYGRGSLSAYVWLSQGLLGSINVHGRSDFADRIKSGDVAVDFARPIDPLAATVATEVGRSICTFLPRGLPSVAVGLLVGAMTLPGTPVPYLLGAVSILLAITISATTAYLLATIGFWLVETRGVQTCYMIVSGFFAGLFVPLGLFPGRLLTVARCTPFPSFLQYPVDVLSGHAHGAAALGRLGEQAGWLVLTAAGAWLLTRAGRRKLEIQGG